MALRLYNTLTKKKETFEPIEPGKVGIYVCGPTVYKPAHIGHAVGPVIFDALKNYLQYKGYQVTFVVNVTDVDDKIIVEAGERNMGMAELAEEVTANYLRSLRQLGVRGIDCMPKVTEHMGEIISLVGKLVDQDAAYAVDGDVYFDVAADEDYGKLSNRKPEEQESGTRDLAGAGKRNAGDFALWKSAKPGEPAWDSPWGPGRPGWHIECSAMSMKYLGETFDIHGGGLDLVFPHHENEIAQSETATGKLFAKYWMHNGLTRSKTKAGSAEKMSKSIGNVRQLDALLEEFRPEVVRFFLLSTHYRRPIDFSDEALVAAGKGMQVFYRLFERIGWITQRDPHEDAASIEGMHRKELTETRRQFLHDCLDLRLTFLETMDDDFNTAGAIGHLHELAGRVNRFIEDEQLERSHDDEAAELLLGAGVLVVSLGRLMGMFDRPPAAKGGAADDDRVVGGLVELLIGVRTEARARKDFAQADAVRDELAKLGFTLEDRADGTKWRRA